MTKTQDAVVVGGGIFGLASAFALLKAGLQVTLIDKAKPGQGPSGGILGALSPHMPEAWNPKKAFQLKALMAAPEFWADVEAISGKPSGYARIGRLMPIISEKARLQALERIRFSQEQWPEPISWNVLDHWDDQWIAPGAFGLVHETLSARIFPRTACTALAAAIPRLGGTIKIGEAAQVTSGAVTLTDGTKHKAKTILIAAGFDSYSLLGFPASFGTQVKGQAALLSPSGKSGPLIFADGLYILPHADGRIAVGSTSERTFQHPTSTDEALEALIAKARAICPALESASVTERWAAPRPRASLPDPILGEMPEMPGVLIASGGFKIGFGLAPEVANTILKLQRGEDPKLPESFHPTRQLAHSEQQIAVPSDP